MESVVTLADALPKEQARCRELLEEYAEIGPNGAFGHMAIEMALEEADSAVMSGDPVRMLKAYTKLKECK